MSASIKSTDSMMSFLLKKGKPLRTFHKGMRITGTSTMIRKPYYYTLVAEPGEIDPTTGFTPELTPAEMLLLGVFEGKYLNDCLSEYPAEWFLGAILHGTLSPTQPNPLQCNFFGVKSRQPLSVWKENGWAPSTSPPATNHYKGILSHFATNPDERGWFQWYCRYWLGRRIPDLDAIQIARWKSFRRHAGAIRARCRKGDLSCSPRERQALLQWAYNPFI